MATELGQAYVQIIPSAEGISGAISEALGGEATAAGTTSGNNFASAMSGVLSKGAKLTAAGTAAAAAAIAGVSKALVDGAGSVANYGDNIDKMSQKMGISATAYQEWDAVMQHSGTSIDGMQRGMTTLSKQAEKGSDAFQKLGISQKDVASMSKEDLFAAVITGLQGMEEGTERTVLAQQLLGGAAKELGPLLNTSAAETQAMKDRVHELGGVMSDEAVKAAAGYQDSLRDMTTAFDSVKRNMLSEFLPSMTTVMDGLTELFSGNSDKGIGLIKEGISGFADKMGEVIPEMVTVGSEIISSLLTSIVENLPHLMEAGLNAIDTIAKGILENLPMFGDTGMQIISMLGNYIIENLPELIDAALQIILQLALSISESLPELIPTIVDVVLQITETLIDNVDLLVDGAIALIIGLTEGIINALPRLIKKLPEIVIKIVEALIRNAPKLMMVGPQLILQLTTGILQNLPQLIAAVPKLIGDLYVTLINEAPKMIKNGVELVKRLIEGIMDALPMLLAVPAEIVLSLVDTFADAATNLIESGRNLGESIQEGISSFIDDAMNWGRDLIDNFIDGLLEKWDDLRDTVSDVADSIKEFLGFSEPEEGPLSNFHTYAPDMMKLFAQGIKDNTAIVTDRIKKSFNFESLITDQGIDLSTGTNTTSGDSSGGFVQNLTINAPTEQDPSEIARLTRNANREFVLQLRTT